MNSKYMYLGQNSKKLPEEQGSAPRSPLLVEAASLPPKVLLLVGAAGLLAHLVECQKTLGEQTHSQVRPCMTLFLPDTACCFCVSSDKQRCRRR